MLLLAIDVLIDKKNKNYSTFSSFGEVSFGIKII